MDGSPWYISCQPVTNICFANSTDVQNNSGMSVQNVAPQFFFANPQKMYPLTPVTNNRNVSLAPGAQFLSPFYFIPIPSPTPSVARNPVQQYRAILPKKDGVITNYLCEKKVCR